MYQDAKEELKRLEEALLEVEPDEDDLEQWNIDEALADIPDLPKKDNRNNIIFGLTIAVIALTAAIVGLLIFVFVRYGGMLL